MGRPTGPGAMGGGGVRRRALLLLPWVLAAVLVASTWVGGPRRPSDGTATSAGQATTAPSTTGTDPAGLVLPPGVELDVRTATRRALGWHGLVGDVGPRDRWVVDQALEDARVRDDGTAEVVVRATVIVRGDEGWQAPATASVVVPLVTTPALAVAGPARVLEHPRPTGPGARAGAQRTDGDGSPSRRDDPTSTTTTPGVDR